jgi:hypothetical protein
MRHVLLALMLALAAPLAWPALAVADDETAEDEDEEEPEPQYIWAWVGEGGTISFSDSRDQIPARYRSSARKTNLRVGPGAQPSTPTARSAPSGGSEAPPPPSAREPETPQEQQPSRGERLQQLRGERKEVVEELTALDEGWSDVVDDAGLSDAELDARVGRLLGRLDALDAAIDDLD